MAVMTSETGGSGGCGESTVASSTRRRTLSSSRWFTTDEAGRMLHVTDALLSLGTLQVASRSVPTRKSRGPRFKREHALSLSLSLSLESRDMENQKRWRTGKRGLQKSMEVSEDISPFPTFSSKLCSRAFHVFPETVVSERGDLEQVFFEKNKKLKRF